jgi:hypothetical protein
MRWIRYRPEAKVEHEVQVEQREMNKRQTIRDKEFDNNYHLQAFVHSLRPTDEEIADLRRDSIRNDNSSSKNLKAKKNVKKIKFQTKTISSKLLAGLNTIVENSSEKKYDDDDDNSHSHSGSDNENKEDAEDDQHSYLQ